MAKEVNQKIDGGVNSAILYNQKQKKQATEIEVLIERDIKHWFIKVKALSDYSYISGIDKEFTVRLKTGRNVIGETNWDFRTVKECLKIEERGNNLHLAHYYKDKDYISNYESYKLETLRIEGMWKREGLKISEDGAIIWWLLEARKLERWCATASENRTLFNAGCNRLLSSREKNVCSPCLLKQKRPAEINNVCGKENRLELCKNV